MDSDRLASDLLTEEAQFLADVKNAEIANKRLFETEHGTAHRVWLEMIGLLIRIYNCKSGVIGRGNEIASRQLVYLATFVQGAQLTKRSIMEGHYAKAAAALKQDIELLSRIREIAAGEDVEGKTPNVRNLPDGFRMIYGALNKLAHPSNTELLEEHLQQLVLESESHLGLSPIPVFCSDSARGMCEVHVHICFQMAREFVIMLARLHGTSDAEFGDRVAEIKIIADRIRIVLPSSIEA